MKTYWDTSGLINAAVSGTVLQRLAVGEHTTRTHALAEFYGILTGRGIRWERDGPRELRHDHPEEANRYRGESGSDRRGVLS